MQSNSTVFEVVRQSPDSSFEKGDCGMHRTNSTMKHANEMDSDYTTTNLIQGG